MQFGQVYALMAIASVTVPATMAGAQGAGARPSSTAQQSRVVAWAPGNVECSGGGRVNAAALRRPYVQLRRVTMSTLPPITLNFAVDGTGRTLSIQRGSEGMAMYYPEVEAAVAASHFSAGAPRTGCRVTYTPTVKTIAEADIADLAAYSVLSISGPLPREGWQRLTQIGNCGDDPRPQPLSRSFPAFDDIPATAGARDWALVGYDTDAQGVPTNVRIRHTSGNAALDAASINAVAASRFTGGARTECSYPYWRRELRLAAPDAPDGETLRPANGNCPYSAPWATEPTVRYPQSFLRRQIEGWAIITFDIEPGGRVSNTRIAAAQPAEAFGRAAIGIMQSGRGEASEKTVTGCVQRISFRISSDNVTPNVDDDGNSVPAN